MDPARFILVGGFLGSGKTTALLRLALHFTRTGMRAGLITNDQAADLVDTGTLRVRGFRVEEVAGGCFCCRFDELARAVDRLRETERPQVLLGEPVGSCTDLVATVINPMKRIYGAAYAVAPYSVLVDPGRAEQMFLRPGFGGFSSKVAYIFRKQIEEADAIVLNKVDLLKGAGAGAIEAALRSEFPDKRLLRVSALTGEGFGAWLELLGAPPGSTRRTIDLDYDLYAEGEAELGWLNATASVAGADGFRGDDLVLDLLSHLGRGLASEGLEPAHLKVLFADEAGGAALASLVRSGEGGRLSRSIGRPSRAGTLTVNARAHAAPATLRRRVEAALGDIGSRHPVLIRIDRLAEFRPARPVPVHRDTRPGP
ncbi:MAG: GTP-binding protein [Acidobacteriota bacterium]